MDELLSVWLVPDKNDLSYLTNIVNRLSKENNSPSFIPHLTLFGDIQIEFNKLKETVDDIFSSTQKFSVKKIKINQSELFFKTVFIEFELNDNLKNAFLSLSDKTDKRRIDSFKPHISLMYKLIPENEKLKIIENLNIKDEFSIGSVYINAPKKGDKDFFDVKNWQSLYKKELIQTTRVPSLTSS